MNAVAHLNSARVPRIAAARAMRGLTLIEILVTMVLLGVGLLGLAGLQLRGMQVNQGSNFRSQAAILAEDLADRMRSDTQNAGAHNYDNTWLANTSGTATGTVGPLISDWLFRLASLPAGCAVVDTTNQAPLTVITVTWDDTRAIRSATGSAAAGPGPAPCSATAVGNGSFVLTTQ